MSRAHTSTEIKLRDYEPHTFKRGDGVVCSALDLGAVDIMFDSAEEARQVAARCTEIADAIDAMTREGQADA